MPLHVVSFARVKAISFHPMGSLLAAFMPFGVASAAMRTLDPLMCKCALDGQVSALVHSLVKARAALLLCTVDVLALRQEHWHHFTRCSRLELFDGPKSVATSRIVEIGTNQFGNTRPCSFHLPELL